MSSCFGIRKALAMGVFLLVLPGLALVGCRQDSGEPTESGGAADAQGYSRSNCRQETSQALAAKYTRLLVDGFEEQIRQGAVPAGFFTEENVQRMVCMANEESTFGRDTGSMFSGSFQIAGDTGPTFCRGLNYRGSESDNTECALRVMFSSIEGSPGSGRWTKWPLSSEHCRAGGAMRACYDGVVSRTIDSLCPRGLGRCGEPEPEKKFEKQCQARIRMLSLPEENKLRVAVGSACPATKASVVLMTNTGAQVSDPAQELLASSPDGKAAVVDFAYLRKNPHVYARLKLQRNDEVYFTSDLLKLNTPYVD